MPNFNFSKLGRVRLGLAAILLASCAQGSLAQSIDPIGATAVESDSVVSIACATCPQLKKRGGPNAYVVHELAIGTQKVEIKEINGKMKVVRTEAWLGGSPIVFISSVPGAANNQLAEQAMPPADATKADAEVPQTIDASTTSAVTADMAPSYKSADPAKGADIKVPVIPKASFQPDTLQLR